MKWRHRCRQAALGSFASRWPRCTKPSTSFCLRSRRRWAPGSCLHWLSHFLAKTLTCVHFFVCLFFPSLCSQMLFLRINASFKMHLKRQLSRLGVVNDGGPQHGWGRTRLSHWLPHFLSDTLNNCLSVYRQAGGGGCGLLHRERPGAKEPGAAGPEHGWDLGAEKVMEADWDQKQLIKTFREEEKQQQQQLNGGGAWSKPRPLWKTDVEQGTALSLEKCCHLLSHCVQFNWNASKLLGMVLVGGIKKMKSEVLG